MKVAIFTDGFPPSFGGAENAVLRYALALSETDDVIVFAPDNSKPYDDTGYPFKVVRVKSLPATKNDRYAMPFIDGKVKRALKEFQPDVVHFQSVGQMAAYALRYAKKHNIPSVSTVHTKYYYCYKHSFKLKILTKILLHTVMKRVKRATYVCAVSESMKETLICYGVKKDITVIKNGGEKGFSVPEKRISDKFTFLYVGLIVDYKNLEFSLKALSELKKRGRDFVFYIVGKGPHIKKFQRLKDKLGLSDNVIFTGGIFEKEELFGYYRGSDLMLFPSVFDSDGLVLLEAAEEDLPSLTLKGTGAAERITDNVTGFISEHSVKDFAERIEYIMDNPKIREEVGKKAKSIYTDWKDTAKHYRDLYKKLIEKYR